MKSKSYFMAFIIFLFGLAGYAAEPRINTLGSDHFLGQPKPTGIAIRGYDPVAYFILGRPVRGQQRFSMKWMDATWLFSTAENRELFKEKPEAYAPQFGGYCAYGVSQNYLVKIEPENWTIIDGKLYLNFNNSVQRKWERNARNYILQGQQFYEDLVVD